MAFRYISTPEPLFMQNRCGSLGTPNSELKSSYSNTSTVAPISHNCSFQTLDLSKMIRHKIQKNAIAEVKKRIKYYVADRISGIATQQAAISLFPSDQNAIQPLEKQFDGSNPIYSLKVPPLTKRSNAKRNITQFMTTIEELKYKEECIRRSRFVKADDVEKLIFDRMKFRGNFAEFFHSRNQTRIEFSLAVEVYNPINRKFGLERRANWAILKNKFDDVEYLKSIDTILMEIHQIFSSQEAKVVAEGKGYFREEHIRQLFSVKKGHKKHSDIKDN